MVKKFLDFALALKKRTTELEDLSVQDTSEYVYLCKSLAVFAKLFEKAVATTGIIDSKTYRCIVAHYFKGLTYPQISRELYPEDTASALNKKVHRGLNALEKVFGNV